MYHQIRVTADGAGEVAVIGGGQAVVAQGLRVVPGPHQAFQERQLKQLLVRGTLDGFHQFIQVLALADIVHGMPV